MQDAKAELELEAHKRMSNAAKAIGCTVLISSLPTCFLFAVPFSKGRSPIPPSIHRSLLGFAAGGLLGDVFLHSIPHLLMEGGHKHGDHTMHENSILGATENLENSHGLAREHQHHDHEHHEGQDSGRSLGVTNEDHVSHDHSSHGKNLEKNHGRAHDHQHHDHEHHDHLEGQDSGGSLGGTNEDQETHDHSSHGNSHEDRHDADSHQDHFDDHGHEDAHAKGLAVGLNILAGFGLFFLFEKIIRACNGGSHHHSHSQGGGDDAAAKKKTARNGLGSSSELTKGFLLPAGLGAGGWLNLAADSLHNFTDGVAIGAAFVGGSSSGGGGGGSGLGVATFLSVLAHEIPHEIGDFAILVQQGCSPTQAIRLQFATALFALVGTGAGLLSEGYQGANETLLSLVSGGFVYLATMTVMPELQRSIYDDDDKGHIHGRAEGKGAKFSGEVLQTFYECTAFGAGVLMMVLVAKLEVHDH